MPRRTLGDKPLTNAERQARYRLARATAWPVIHYRASPTAAAGLSADAAALPSLCVKRHADTVVPEDLEQIATATAKHK
jgi:hypothetical protein